MEKTVSIEVSRFLFRNGFPQDECRMYYADGVLLSESTINGATNGFSDIISAPSYFEAWSWMTDTGKHAIEVVRSGSKILCREEPYIFFYGKTTEEAIVGIVDYIVSVDRETLKNEE